jgi:transcriptional regulator with XRE-family HTH domain
VNRPEPDLSARQLEHEWLHRCGERLAVLRQARGLDRRELALIVSTSESTIARVEQGVVAPRDLLRFAIAAALRVEVGEIWPAPSLASLRRRLRRPRPSRA